jgi:hypothetical protein
MKKWIAAFLAAWILLSGICVSAESAGDADETASGLDTFDFGDFFMTFDANMVGITYDKADGQMWFILYPDYDESAMVHPNINVAWTETVLDPIMMDAQEYAEGVLEGMAASMESAGIAIENEEVLSAQPDELDGKDTITIQCVYEMEGYTVYTIQIVVPDEAFGTYFFTATYFDQEQEEALLEILNTITWAA